MPTASPRPDFEVVHRDDPARKFPSLSMGFNVRWKAKNCERIYLTNTPQGVCLALDQATTLYGPGKTKIISGGHCYENFVFNDNTHAVLNVSPLTEWGWDETRQAYFLSSGDTNWEAFKKLFFHLGKVLPGGSCYSVGEHNLLGLVWCSNGEASISDTTRTLSS